MNVGPQVVLQNEAIKLFPQKKFTKSDLTLIVNLLDEEEL